MSKNMAERFAGILTDPHDCYELYSSVICCDYIGSS